MPRFVPSLRSWLKEERRLLPRSVRLRWVGFGSLVLMSLLLTAELSRRDSRIRAHLDNERRGDLELVSSALSDISRTAFDWARWEDALNFIQGHNPGFVQRDMAHSSLFDAGGVMVLFNHAGDPLVSYSRAGINQPADHDLQRCAQSNLDSLQSLETSVNLFCPGAEHRPYLGVLLQVSNNDSTAPADGALVMFEPLIRPAHGPRLRSQLTGLAAQMVSGDSRNLGSLPSSIRLHGPDRQLVGLRPQSSLTALLESLRDDLFLLLGLVVPSLAIRMQLTLTHRRQRLSSLHQERRAKERIRKVCQQLDELLAQHGLSDHGLSVQRRVMDRLVDPEPSGPELADRPLAVGGRLDSVARRFQHFLDGAQSLALLDQLTQLPNRRFFIEQLDRQVQHHERGKPAVALLFVDIDRFKEINDSFGHSIGDQTLALVAERLRQQLNPEDFLARYGGDEFVILHQLESDDPLDVEKQNAACLRFAEQVAAAFEAPIDLEGVAIELNLSLGVTLLRPEMSTAEAAIQQCDLAMLQAKQNKHNRIAIFELDLSDPQGRDYELYNELLQAIRDQQLTVLFQPIVDAKGLPHGVEALARWQHRQRGWVPPDQFISLAERHRQILLLSDTLLQKALYEYGGIQLSSQRGLDLSFNINPAQLEDPNMVSRIMHKLELHQVRASQLTLEITERGVMEGSVTVQENLRQLRHHGIRISLDDFGTGYSSLSLLSQLHPDEVKIDRSFVMAMQQDPYALQIITLLCRMAPELGFQLVAEGVEDLDSFDRLRRLGVDRFQGYWFARPLACEAVDNYTPPHNLD